MVRVTQLTENLSLLAGANVFYGDQDSDEFPNGDRDIPKEQPQTPFVIDEANVDTPEGKAAAYVGSC